MRELPDTVPSDSLAPPVLNPDLTAPDLALPPLALVPTFPLVIHDTALVLEAGAPGAVLVHWHLEANDYVGISHAFPATSSAPAPVLRLRQLRPDGGADFAAEARLLVSGYQGDGERGFVVGREVAQFEAELGLTNDDGGWLLLARSNRLALGASAAPPPARDAQAPPTERRVTAAPAPAPATAGTPLVPTVMTDPRLEAPLTPLVPEFPLPLIDAACSAVDRHFSAAISAQLGQRAAPASHAELSASVVNQHQPLLESPLPPSIPPLVYGCASARTAGVVIEAELRIHGWGAPNSDIDLFGQRYRIGAGGRFQLLLRVDDPALLAVALRQHPPPELTRFRPD